MTIHRVLILQLKVRVNLEVMAMKEYSTHTPQHTHGVMDIIVGNGHIDSSNPVSISRSTNTVGKGMNPISLPPAISKIVGQTGLFSLSMATGLEKGKFR